MSEKLITITKLAKDLKVSLRTLRHWEDCGLIKSTRRGHGKRQYTLEMAKQAEVVQVLRACRFGVADIQLYLGSDKYDCEEMLRAKRIENARERASLDQAIGLISSMLLVLRQGRAA